MHADTLERYVSSGLEELRASAIRAIAIGLLAIVAYLFLAIGAQPAAWGLAPMVTAAALVVTAALAWGFLSIGVVPAAVALLVGLMLVITSALYTFANSLLATTYPLVAVVAGMLLGWRYAVLAGIASGGIAFAISAQSPEVLPTAIVNVMPLLIAINLAVAWLLARPTHVAIDWAWRSYSEVITKIEEARDRQAELARLSAALSDACLRLEVANEELERARRAAVEARRLKTEFAAAISHELRTPLNLIIGFSEMMVIAPQTYEGETLPPGYRGDVEAIYRNACHLSGLVDDVLDLAQVEAHRMALEKDWIDLEQIVDEAMATVATLFRDRGLTLRKELPTGLPVLHADGTRIRQVLINLLTNAARFTTVGGATISARVDGQDVVVAVEDTGPGIPPHELPAIFKEFHHHSGTQDGRYGGRGLGLTISRRFVELHGGSIWAENVPEKGARFSFTLPLSLNVVSAPVREAWESWVRASRPQVESAVVVLSPDTTTVEVFRRYLEGVSVVGAQDIEHAQELARRRSLQALIVATTTAPRRVAAKVASIPELRGVPTFVCPVRTRTSAHQDLDVSAYLVKPVDREQLRTAIATLEKRISCVAVIEDDPEMAALLTRMLRSLSPDYRIVSASDGAGAIELLRSESPDVVLLDLLMPRVDGYQVIEAMRRDESLASIPIIVITARSLEQEVVTAEELTVSRAGGLSVGEVMKYLQVILHGASAMPSERGEERRSRNGLDEHLAGPKR